MLHARKSGFALKIFLNSGTMNENERCFKYFTARKRLKIRSTSEWLYLPPRVDDF